MPGKDAEEGAAAALLERCVDAFTRRFGRAPTVAARAPGRVNLIGEHTDYNEGLVLPCAIDRETIVVAAPRADSRVCALALDLQDERERSLEALEPQGDWSDYVVAPAFAWHEAGISLPGVELAVASRVPAESGLSSSAALGVAVATAWVGVAGIEAQPREIADRVHRGENAFVGVGCGILDQYASALGRAGAALRIDCRSREVEPVPLGDAPFVLLVARSGVTRALASGGYRDRVAECGRALALARDAGIAAPHATALRDLPPAALPALEATLPDTELRRARHVITENLRVDGFLRALRAGDRAAAGEVLRAGQASLRDDYAVSVPELDALCEIADAHPACFGSRLTGAGFGGCTIHLVDPDGADEVAALLERRFRERSGRSPEAIRVVPSAGASRIPLGGSAA